MVMKGLTSCVSFRSGASQSFTSFSNAFKYLLKHEEHHNIIFNSKKARREEEERRGSDVEVELNVGIEPIPTEGPRRSHK